MWIRKDEGYYKAYNNDNKLVGTTMDVASALQALWLDAGSPDNYTLYTEDDAQIIVVKKKYKTNLREAGE